MSNVILSMPRCGSAWLASYFGYLHDPLVHTTWDNIRPHHSIVDTGACVDPIRAAEKWGRRPVALIRDNADIVRSLQMLNYPVTPELVEGWEIRLQDATFVEGWPLFRYEDLLGLDSRTGEIIRLHECLGEEVDWLKWDNHQKFNVQHSIADYDAEAFEYYVSWLNAS